MSVACLSLSSAFSCCTRVSCSARLCTFCSDRASAASDMCSLGHTHTHTPQHTHTRTHTHTHTHTHTNTETNAYSAPYLSTQSQEERECQESNVLVFNVLEI